MRLGNSIDFIQQQIDGPMKTARPFDGEAVSGAEVHRSIGDQRKDINTFERVLKLVHHLAAENVLGFVDAGRIDQHDLRVVAIQNSLDAVAGSLRLGRNDGDLASNKSIYERGLTGVGAADNCHETRFKWHEIKLYADERPLAQVYADKDDAAPAGTRRARTRSTLR